MAVVGNISVPKDREQLLKHLAWMPEEAFEWFVMWAGGMNIQYPDGLGGFQPGARKSIEDLHTLAKTYIPPYVPVVK